jgi:indolepyruvate decarboxylase
VIISDTNFGVSIQQIDRRHAIQAIDHQVVINHHVYPNVPLAGLVTELLRLCPDNRSSRIPSKSATYPRNLPADDAKVTPQDIATAINDLMHRVGRIPIASDIGDCLFTAMDIQPTEFVAPGYYATMGFGVPAGLGIQASTGLRPIVLVGDGAFQMTGFELGNCHKYHWDPIVIVFNNSSWEMLRAFQPESRFNSLERWNFQAIARSLGGNSVVVRTRHELQEALNNAWQRRGQFQLLDVMLEPGQLSPTLSRYAEGFSKRKKDH